MIEYKEARPPAPVALIERLERLVGRGLPSEYRDYLAGQDGGWAKDNSLAVDEVFGVAEDLPYSANIWQKLDVFSGRHPEWLLPVAQDVYGNLFLLSVREDDLGSVWFWDHEEEACEDEPPSEENVTLVAENWTDLLRKVQPVTVGNDG
ncbi:SMI1/KNR4 family protein [Actinoplanes regularis]|uniref:SMI1/KNR4 family protein n=1 Tax=Actinoplanes regularis TaxID=52697 RepID=UPI0024A0468C|nr:SMI1/KNR4 family protein [Actinoplanes regularis]GLW31856.1 hypothetical protein Areg01_47950 [Actinoplanes regularis]